MPSHAENRLALEKSPYLLQHRSNPVDWFPYGDEAFAKAKAEDKPIFLSIGYSTCHWCHVMERESFEDAGTARLMNELFVNIKVDREERPDVDHIYMQAVMAMTGQGGWPLSVWLTPDLTPFYGGTYFPPEARYGRQSFKDVLKSLSQFYSTRRTEVLDRSAKLMAMLRHAESGDTEPSEIPKGLARRLAGDLEASFDSQYGGFGQAPKFPRPTALSFLAHHHSRSPTESIPPMLEKTLEMMWRGGLYDHVGGGFARYSTDVRWLVPHFEKMLYDNAMLVEAYIDGHLLTGRQDFADVVSDVMAFTAREMTHPEGGFFSAQDADSEGVEGKFYVFSLAELETVLGEDARDASQVYGADEHGNFEERNILYWPKSVATSAQDLGQSAETLWSRHQKWRKKLYDFREARIRPGLDDKVLASWNGLMIAAMARAAVVFGEPSWRVRAERAAQFIELRMRASDGSLLRRWREGEARFDASLDDYAALGLGYLRLFEATGRAAYLRRALELALELEKRFADPKSGGYYFAEARPDLVARMKDSYDGALPSGNSQAALLLARLGAVLDREDLRDRGMRTVRAFADSLRRHPEGYPLMVSALVELVEPPRTLFVVGEGAALEAMLQAAHKDFFPGRNIIPVLDAERQELERLGVPLHGKAAPKMGAAAFLCENAACVPYSVPSR